MNSCSTNKQAPAPSPSPCDWSLIRLKQYEKAHVVEVRYYDCTNFEGMKIMVLPGVWEDKNHNELLDPHFSEEEGSPIARFRPDSDGWRHALEFAENYGN